MKINAIFDKVIYETQKDGLLIGLYKIKECDNKCAVITGQMLPKDEGITYIFEGDWINHAKYGRQFKAINFEEDFSTEENIIKFLTKVVKGIGPKTAKKIVDQFGTDTLNVLDRNIDALLSVKGFPKSKFEDVKASYQSQRKLKEVITKFSEYNLSTTAAIRAYAMYKDKVISILEKSPYLLHKVEGITFEQADKLGRRLLGYEFNYDRFVACAEYVLYSNEYAQFENIIGERASGSNGMEINDFGKVMLSLLYFKNLTGKDVCDMTCKMISEKKLKFVKKKSGQYIFLSGLASLEHETAKHIHRLSLQKNSFDLRYVEKAISMCPYELNTEQVDAIKSAFTNNVSIIIGVPGSGKTTILDLIAKAYKMANPKNGMYFLAPSGKAAARIKETLGSLDSVVVSTVHSALEIRQDTASYPEESSIELEDCLVVLDETSMVDSRVAYKLFSALGKNVRVVLSGDDEQLQSVGSGAVLRDLIDANVVHKTELTHVYRQDEKSNIYCNLYNIRNGITDLCEGGDFFFKEEDNALKMEDEMLNTYYEKVKEYGIENVMLIAPFKNHEAGVFNFNCRIQEHFNPENGEEMRGVYAYREGDVVMQLKNDYELNILNGDIGVVTGFGYGDNGKEVYVKYAGVTKKYDKENLNELTLGYSYTIHKSQGSEAKCVITCATKMHGRMLKRNVYYTAITRGKNEVYIFGERECLKKAIETVDLNERITLLKDYLLKEFGEFTEIAC